jgi:hypothetical protein
MPALRSSRAPDPVTLLCSLQMLPLLLMLLLNSLSPQLHSLENKIICVSSCLAAECNPENISTPPPHKPKTHLFPATSNGSAPSSLVARDCFFLFCI